MRPWLMTIALNVRREYFRKKGRRPEEPLALDGRMDPSEWPEDPVARRQDADRVRVALQRLPANQRDVIELHWFAGLPMAEVAAAVGASVTAVKVRAHRGYERLRDMLKTR